MTACEYGEFCPFRNPEPANDNTPVTCKEKLRYIAANDNHLKKATFYLVSDTELRDPETVHGLAKLFKGACQDRNLTRREAGNLLSEALYLRDYHVLLDSGEYYCVCKADIDALFERGEFRYISDVFEIAETQPIHQLQANMIPRWRVIELAMLIYGLKKVILQEVRPNSNS